MLIFVLTSNSLSVLDFRFHGSIILYYFVFSNPTGCRGAKYLCTRIVCMSQFSLVAYDQVDK